MIKKIFKILILIVILFSILEFFTNIFLKINGYSKGEMGYLPRYPAGYMDLPNPNFSLRLKNGGLYSYNEYGFRGNDHFRKDKKNILVIGDSFVDNLVDNNKLFTALLNKKFTNKNFINGGVCGFSNMEEIYYLKQLLKTYRIDGMLFCIYMGNDFVDNINTNKRLYFDEKSEKIILKRTKYMKFYKKTAIYFSTIYLFKYKKILKNIRTLQIKELSFSIHIKKYDIERQLTLILRELKHT